MVPQCSVIMPIYNSEQFLEKTLESVLKQTFADFELIAIDDCSSDSSYEILQRMAKEDKRIKIYRNKENSGVANTRNRGIEAAQGKYIALLDSDDLWLPEKLEKQIDYIERKGCMLSYCSYGFIDKDNNDIGNVFCVPSHINMKDLLKKNVISCSTVIVEREFFLKHKFNSEYYHEDFVTWIDMLKECQNSYGHVEELAKIRIMNGSRSGNKMNSAKQRWLVYRNYLNMGVPIACYYYSNYAFLCIIKYWTLRKGFN